MFCLGILHQPDDKNTHKLLASQTKGRKALEITWKYTQNTLFFLQKMDYVSVSEWIKFHENAYISMNIQNCGRIEANETPPKFNNLTIRRAFYVTCLYCYATNLTIMWISCKHEHVHMKKITHKHLVEQVFFVCGR